MSAPDTPRPVGSTLPNWTPPPWPRGQVLNGRYARVEPLETDAHAAALFDAYRGHDWLWDYMPYGPFSTVADYTAWVRQMVAGADPMFYAITDLDTGVVGGVASYLRIAPQAGSIEVGNINLAPVLQRTRAATEAMALMMGWAFAAGYRRYEWKCDALNQPSRRAAQRLGFSFEGVFRQAVVVKGRNRDTAWFAVTDGDWPKLSAAYRNWLAPENFRADGRQTDRLSALTAPVRVSSDPTV